VKSGSVRGAVRDMASEMSESRCAFSLRFSLLMALVALLLGAPSALAQDAYVTNQGSNSVSVIDTQTNRVVGPPIPVGTTPAQIAISPDGRFAYVTNQGSNSVSVIDTQTNQVVGAPIPVGSEPTGIAITPDGEFAYVTNAGSSSVSVIATRTNQVVGSISVGDPTPITFGSPPGLVDYPNPVGIAITPDGNSAYVINSSDTNDPNDISVIDIRTNGVVGTISDGVDAAAMAISTDGQLAYVSSFPELGVLGAVSLIDTNANQVVGSISVGGIASGIAAAPDGKAIYVARPFSTRILEINTQTNQVSGGITVPSFPSAIAITPDGGSAYVALGGERSQTVSAIDTETNKVVASITVGRDPGWIAIGPGPETPTSVAHVRVRCPSSAKPGGCKFSIQAVTKGSKGKAESAVASTTIGAGDSALLTLKPTPAFSSELASAKKVLIRETTVIRGSRRTRLRRVTVIH
jgi:YVTN family beta-propeller protein